MKKHEFTSVYCTERLRDHDQYKNRLLSEIEGIGLELEANGSTTYSWIDDEEEGLKDQISSADWDIGPELDRTYQQTFFGETSIMPQLRNMFHELGHEGFAIGKSWFQQYNKSDVHNWHTHGEAHWACVYYLELPEGTPPTILRDWSGNIIEPDVSEGDIILFPAQTIHTSPPNEVDGRKTVIAFNIVCSQQCHDL